MEYIYTQPSLSVSFCESICSKFSKIDSYNGVTYGGLDKNIKDTSDVVIPENDEWKEINDILSCNLEKGIKEYLTTLNNKKNYKGENNYGFNYQHLNDKLYLKNNFMIQKYEKGKGKYVYHDDGSHEATRYRVITYLWYLNDVEEGGETDFFGGTFKVKPETGKLLLFPAFWAFPHRGNRPISSDKYIITGWLYQDVNKEEEKIPVISSLDIKRLSLEPTKNKIPDIIELSQIEIIFEYFYHSNKLLFHDYKYSIFENKEIDFFSFTIIKWLFKKVKSENEFGKINPHSKIMPFLTSSFEIIMDTIKKIYGINPVFNIIEWYLLKPDEYYENSYDLYVQIDLNNGMVYFGKKTIKLPIYSILFFVNFSFIYKNSENEEQNLTLKELAEPFLDRIT